MKTLSVNSVNWLKAFFMAAGTVTKSKAVMYRGASIAGSKKNPGNRENIPGTTERKPVIGDIMRTAHRGNFSAGPNFLFHPGWFK